MGCSGTKQFVVVQVRNDFQGKRSKRKVDQWCGFNRVTCCVGTYMHLMYRRLQRSSILVISGILRKVFIWSKLVLMNIFTSNNSICAYFQSISHIWYTRKPPATALSFWTVNWHTEEFSMRHEQITSGDFDLSTCTGGWRQLQWNPGSTNCYIFYSRVTSASLKPGVYQLLYILQQNPRRRRRPNTYFYIPLRLPRALWNPITQNTRLSTLFLIEIFTSNT